MLARIAVLALAFAHMMVGCGGEAQGANYLEGELLVKFHTGVPEERMAEIHQTLGNRVVESWPEIRWYRVLLKKGVTVQEGVWEYRSLKEVEGAEPNFKGYLGTPPQGPPTQLPQ
ncbi:MAG TPA: hypothetical protein VF431_05525 [Candidatus Methylomirabilis sp.]